MPARYFICPDGQLCGKQDCMKQCRMGSRCLSIPTLRFIAKERPWSGKPSTTMLIKGTREAYIDIMYDDLETDPMDMMFMFLGSKAHLSLESLTESELSEERITDKTSSGALDLYDPENQTLYDYKTSGSYKVAKALGYEVVEVPSDELYKIGPKKGTHKTKKITQIGKSDCKEWELQLNDYRIKLESQGFPVKEMIVEAIVRDGGTYMAESRGIVKNAYLIPIKRLPDQEVTQYFQKKAFDLIRNIEAKTMPEACTSEENWGYNKCKNYCRSWKHCDIGMKMHQAKEVVVNE